MDWPWAMQVRGLLAFVAIFMFTGCSSLFFHPTDTVYRTPSHYDLKYQDVYFKSKDSTSLHAWHIFPQEESKGLVFVAHGNAQNLSSHFVSWVWLLKEGYEIFIFDYREYGKSEGKSSIVGSIEDTRAALDYVESVYDSPYVAVGQSLGGTMLLNALDQRDNTRIKSIVIDSTFTGFSDIASTKMNDVWLTWPFQWIPYLSLSSQYDAKDRITKVSKPLLFLHGSLDMIIPVNESWKLFELSSLPREFWIVKEAGHIQALDNTNVRKEFLQFLQSDEEYYDVNYSRMKIYE